MSDQPQGPGWWQASDYKWYPPQQAPQPQPAWVPPPAGQSPFAQPPKKSKAPWIIGVLVLLIVLAGGCVAALVFATGSAVREARSNKATVVGSTVPGATSIPDDGNGGGGDGGSRTSPVAPGTDISLGNGWTVRVDSADLTANAANVISGANQFNSPAPEGFRYIVVTMTASYEGRSDTPTESPALGFSSSVFGSANVERNAFDSTAVPPEPAFDGYSELAAGGSASGNVVFQVGADETDLVLRFQPVLTFDSTEAWVKLG